ncbi:hypothetical protein PCC7424_5075 [Gloeothece citriformis PCC 7424]|uniref:Uncharacterized protein n=1 Tax=Gloeothece citriformis (strain PCC 7424) TaxID=65393 RepID=B7KGT9_GLOC7|nr:hypothetical protein PCC7424_5075 [Gloeothece citriformis PCC 7424]
MTSVNYNKIICRSLLILFCFYLLYLIKTALGINISDKYHAADALKLPVKVVKKHL